MNLAALSLLGFIISFIIVYVSIPSIVNVARIKGLFDEPGLRKCHQQKVPNLGGIAIFAAIIIVEGLLINVSNGRELIYLLASVTVMFFVGIKDDILIIAPGKKLLGEIISVLIMVVLGNLRFTSLHGFLGIHEIDYVSSILLSCFVMVVIVNGFNLIDGIDGLAASIGIVVSLTFGVWFFLVGLINYAVLSAAVAGSLIAFLRFNVFGGSNKIFMGDTGSLILGLIASVFVIRFNETNLQYIGPFSFQTAPAVSFGVLIIPLFDTLRVFILRILKGHSPFHPDMNHLHHRILKLGFTHVEATVIIATTNVFFIFMMLICEPMGLFPLMLLNLVVATALMLVLELFIRMQSSNKRNNIKLNLNSIDVDKVKSA
jgi:UDP-N-acetylmuramyl pentapeptide phosphotransferase/UDP-N-acetylglucosamine-1-phosphate transferase